MIDWKTRRKVVQTDVGTDKITDSVCGVYRIRESVFDSDELATTFQALVWRRHTNNWIWDWIEPKSTGVRHRTKLAAMNACEKHDNQRRKTR